MKNIFMPSLVVLVLACSISAARQTPLSSQPTRIRYIVSQRILAEANEAKAELARVQAFQQQKASEVREKQQALETTRQQLAQTADPANRVKLQQQEQQQRTELERLVTQTNSDVQTLQRGMQANLQVKLKAILDEMLKGTDVQLVLNADSAVVWSAPGTDLTQEVINRWNTKTAGPGTGKASSSK